MIVSDLVCILACMAFVNQYPGSQSGGAVGMPNLPDTPSCEAACRADAACVSYQIDTNPNHILCWIQRSTNAFDPFNLFNQPNIIEYVKTSCSNGKFSVHSYVHLVICVSKCILTN